MPGIRPCYTKDVSLLGTSSARCESSHLGDRGEGQEPVEVAELDEAVLDCTLVELVELDVLLELLVLLLVLVVPDAPLDEVAPVAIVVPRAPALRMPSPARTAVSRRAPRRPLSRMFMGCPFVVFRQPAERRLANPMSRP